MRMPNRRERVWEINAGPDEQYFVATYGSESELFDVNPDVRPTHGNPMPLTRLLRGDTTAPRWTRSTVPARLTVETGMRLWDALPLPVRDELAPDGRPLLLKIASSSPAVSDLPWEWLNDGTGPPLALRPHIRVVRTVPIRLPVPPITVTRPLRVLVVVTNPKDERLLNPWVEIAAVSQRLVDPDYQQHVADQPTLDALQQTLVNVEPHIVHYIGHAGLTAGQGNIILQDYEGRSHWVPASELCRILPSSTRLICLSTCFTAPNYQILGLPYLAKAPGTVPLPTAIANQYPVGQAAVEAFWGAFYSGLLEYQGDVVEAFHTAREAASKTDPGSGDWGSFSLVVRDQTGISFDLGRTSVRAERTSAELSAQFASRLVNDLAEQVTSLGDDTPDGLIEQFKFESARADKYFRQLEAEE